MSGSYRIDDALSPEEKPPEQPAQAPEAGPDTVTPIEASAEPSAACLTGYLTGYQALGIQSHWDVHGSNLTSLVRRVLDGLIGDATRVVVVLEDADGAVRTFGDHQDPWGLFDSLVCSPDEEGDEPPLGPGTRGKLLS